MQKETINSEDYFIIPNPIYDVVFRYLMEDEESAKIVLSTLINEKIVALQFEPLSYTRKIKDPTTKREITLFHLDFKATVELPNGDLEVIMIELQKAKLPEDIFRFKRYITTNFQAKRSEQVKDPETEELITINKPIRLIPIFILNFRIETEINDLLIKTNRIKTGVFKGKKLTSNNHFIDHLTYDLWVIQLPNLSKIKPSDYEGDEYKTKLYALLKLFDQSAQMENRHRLLLVRKLFPGFLERIIMRLQAADSNNPDLEDQMNTEDEILGFVERQLNKAAFFKNKLEKKEQELNQSREELNQKDEQLNQSREELNQSREELNQSREELNQSREEILNLTKMLKKLGLSVEDIQKQVSLSKKEIKEL